MSNPKDDPWRHGKTIRTILHDEFVVDIEPAPAMPPIIVDGYVFNAGLPNVDADARWNRVLAKACEKLQEAAAAQAKELSDSLGKEVYFSNGPPIIWRKNESPTSHSGEATMTTQTTPTLKEILGSTTPRQAYPNRFSGVCARCDKQVDTGAGWVIPNKDSRGGWLVLCDEHVKDDRINKSTYEGRRHGNFGRTSNKNVNETIRKMFQDNETRATSSDQQPWTDTEISQYLQSEFPNSSLDSKSETRIRMYRTCYNASKHSFKGQPAPLVPSKEYDKDGAEVVRRRGGGGGVRKTDMKAMEAIIKTAVAEAVAAQTRPILNVKIGAAKAVKIDTNGKHECFEAILKRVAAKVNVMLVGPTGSGKTHVAEQIAEALDHDFTFNSMSEGVSETEVFGRVLPDENGQWIYEDSPFVKSYRDGGVHLFDEIDNSDPNLLVKVNAAISNGWLSVPVAGAAPIKMHKDFVCISAANTFGRGADRQYVGRNALDEATLNRFTMGTVVMEYDQNLEIAIATALLNDGGAANLLCRWAWSVRTKINDCRLRRSMSTRNIKDAAMLLNAGLSLLEVRDQFFIGWKDDERNMVDPTTV